MTSEHEQSLVELMASTEELLDDWAWSGWGEQIEDDVYYWTDHEN